MLNGSTYMVRPRMQPLKSSFSFRRISNGFAQLFVRTGTVLGKGADERTVFHAGHVARIGLGIIAPRPKFLVKLDESASFDHLLAERVVFLLGTVHPMDSVGLSEGNHFPDPLKEVFVTGKRQGRVTDRDRCAA